MARTCWILLAVSLFLGCSRSLNVTSKTYSSAEINVDVENHFDMIVFTVDFNGDLFIDGVPISELSLDPSPPLSYAPKRGLPLRQGSDGGGGESMPLAMTLQMGSATLYCPCTNCSNEDYPQCNNSLCTFESIMDGGSVSGPPHIFIPAPAVQDPLYVIFSVFAGKSTAEISPVQIHNRFVGAKITRYFDSEASEWVQLVPLDVDFSNCIIDFENTTVTIEDENATAIGPLSVGNFTEQQRTCNYTDFVSKASSLLEAINSMDEVLDKDAMSDASWDVGSYLVRDTWLACTSLAQNLLVYDTVTTSLIADARCYYDRSDPNWSTDPCCNFKLSYSQCCTSKNITVEQSTVVGFDEEKMTAQCNSPLQSSAVLDQYVINSQKSELCIEQTKKRGFSADVWDTMTSFVQTCQEEIFGVDGTPSVCKVDSDCWTQCDTTSEKCVVPYDDPEPYLIACFALNMNEEMQRHLRRKWGLNASSSAQEFQDAFVTHLTGLSCKGPKSFEFQGHRIQEQVDSCDNFTVQTCRCFLEGNETICFNDVFIQPNQTGCLLEESCNWDTSPSVTNDTCLEKTPTEYCGECQGSQCWERSQLAVCQSPIYDSETCSEYGYDTISGNPSFCTVTAANESMCVPDDLCPMPSTQLNSNFVYTRWCGSACYLTTATNASECTTANNAPNPTTWDNNTASGTGFCRLFFFSKATCLANNDTEWFSGRYYRDGVLDTQEKCSEGTCNRGAWLSEEECTSTEFCNMPCRTCVAQDYSQGNLCYEPGVNTSTCTGTLGGKFQDGICRFDWLNTRSTCEAAGRTFESCDDLSDDLDACELCHSNSSECSIVNNAILRCKINNWGQCNTESKCETAGNCNDWELQNWSTDFCRDPTNSASPNCTGACIFDFSTDVWGNPTCPTVGYGWSRLGCIQQNITDETVCALSSGVWKRKAYTQAECEALGYGCREKRFWQPTPKDNETCTACGGVYRSLYTWQSATWGTGEMKELSWVPRTWGSINSWNLTINWTKLNDAMEEVVSVTMRKAIKSQYLCLYTLVTANIKKIACDCGDVTGTGCFDTVELVQIGAADIFSGMEVTNAWGKVTLTTFPDSLPNGTDYSDLSVFELSDLSFLIPEPSSRRGLVFGSAETSQYEIVQDEDGNPIGQIVGSAAEVSGGLGGGTELCLTINPAIPVNPVLTKPVFATPRAFGDYTDLLALTSINVTVEGSQMCAFITVDGLYFPAYITQEADIIPVTTSTTGAEPEPTPTVPDNSNIGVIITSVVVSGVFVAAVTVTVAYLLAKKHNEVMYVDMKDL